MTNDQNIVRARHVDSLAADISDFVTQSNDELHQALQAELAEFDTGGNSAVILGSTSSIVDGTLWLEDVTNAAPVVKLYHGGNVYDFSTTPDFTVIDHSEATVGQKFTVTSDVTSVVGSAYDDSITVNGSNNRIVETAGGNRVLVSLGSDNTIIGGAENDSVKLGVASTSSISSANYVSLNAGDNTVYAYGKNNTIIGGTGDDKIYLSNNAQVTLATGNNTILNVQQNNTIIGGSGNDFISLSGASLNHIDLTAGNNTVVSPNVANARGNGTIIGGTGDDSIILGNNHTKDYIKLATGNNTLKAGNNSTVIGGTGDDSIHTSYNSQIFLTAGNNCVSCNGMGGSNASNCTIIGGSGNDSIRASAGFNLISLIAGNADVNVPTSYNTIYSGSGDHSITIGSSNTIYCGSGNDSIYLPYPRSTVYYFADNDTLALPTVEGITWKASLDSSTVLITVNGSSSSVITCQDYTATQFHISAGGTDGVYTIQGSSLVLAGS